MSKSQTPPEIRSARRLHRLVLPQQPQSSVPRATARRHAGQAGKSWPRCLRKTPPGKTFFVELDAAPPCTAAHLKKVIDSFTVPGTDTYPSGREYRGRWCIHIYNRTVQEQPAMTLSRKNVVETQRPCTRVAKGITSDGKGRDHRTDCSSRAIAYVTTHTWRLGGGSNLHPYTRRTERGPKILHCRWFTLSRAHDFMGSLPYNIYWHPRGVPGRARY